MRTLATNMKIYTGHKPRRHDTFFTGATLSVRGGFLSGVHLWIVATFALLPCLFTERSWIPASWRIGGFLCSIHLFLRFGGHYHDGIASIDAAVIAYSGRQICNLIL